MWNVVPTLSAIPERGARGWYGGPGFCVYKVLQGQMEPNDTTSVLR